MIAPGLIRRLIGCGAMLFAPIVITALIPPHNGVVLLPILVGALLILSPTRAQPARLREPSDSALKKEARS